jgi:rhodanese-related sulfurtransferase
MKIIVAADLKKRLDKDEVLLIDVREPEEYKSESINGACLIPLSEISIEKLPSLSKPIVIHCRSGKRSMDACIKLLASNSSLDVYSLDGGILAWSQAGFKTKKSRVDKLSIERQTQVAIGLIAFVGTVFGFMFNAAFYMLPGFIGLGLIFAGITGWCGMAKLLLKMPWNK